MPLVSFQKFIEDRSGLQAYVRMRQLFDGGNGVGDMAFRKAYVAYWRLRRSHGWQCAYFSVMRDVCVQKEKPTLETILRRIDDIPGSGVEFSFASKMLATIDPAKPIWDRNVRMALGIEELPDKAAACREERERIAVSRYEDLCRQMKERLKDNSIQRELEKFDRMMPSFREVLTPMKKLDCLLWAAGN